MKTEVVKIPSGVGKTENIKFTGENSIKLVNVDEFLSNEELLKHLIKGDDLL